MFMVNESWKLAALLPVIIFCSDGRLLWKDHISSRSRIY
jgi:hypothetical protein